MDVGGASTRGLWRPWLLVALVVGLGIVALRADLPSVAVARDQIEGFGWAAPVIFVAAYAAAPAVS